MKFFNGIRPYESHMASEKHKKKVNEPISVVQDFRNFNFNSTNWKQEPFIICLEKDYKCTLCKTYLNSVDQVISHINGGKHLKEKARVGLITNSNVLSHNRSIDQVDGNSSSSALAGDSGFQFYMHDEEFKELIENMKVFKPNDEIVFDTI
ncbi:hypothetical protein AVEN_270758-1 [Araneus ventricosus]|uniref:C2H2-type domain-containing protein n=1 Tax=Araneus ventricosus TaxID=182803 RepID=A0A4Y2DRM2_ARAVE|nr:hypothetical protein AVEN_270758-1 [Araneus ventricosus]